LAATGNDKAELVQNSRQGVVMISAPQVRRRRTCGVANYGQEPNNPLGFYFV